MENKNKPPFRYTDDIKGYQAAVWAFLLEHSEITGSGKLFIKFGTDGQSNFNKRVLARWKYNYHREDVEAKDARAIMKKAEYKLEKKKKKEARKTAKKARIAKLLVEKIVYEKGNATSRNILPTL